jgi:hypothetical protein
MKQRIINILKPAGVLAVTSALVFSMIKLSQSLCSDANSRGYQQGYGDASQCFHSWLLEVGYAEFDRKTGEWKLADANTIQGDFVEPAHRAIMVNIEDQIHALEDELILLRKQQNINNKRKTDIKKSPADFKKL